MAEAGLRDEVVDLAKEEPFESTEYEGMADFHWRFDTLHEAEGVAEALTILCDRLEKAALMANHASTRTTQLYDRRSDETSLDDVERVMI
jgi:hypothetical protein